MTDGEDRDRRWPESLLPEEGSLTDFYEEKVRECLAGRSGRGSPRSATAG